MTHSNPIAAALGERVSRRTALRGAGAAGVLSALAISHSAGSQPLLSSGLGAINRRQSSSLAKITQGQAIPASWRLWHLSSIDELRPAVPGAVTQAEIDEVIQTQATVSDEMSAAIKTWGTGPAIAPWSAQAVAAFAEFMYPAGMRQARVMATMNTAMHDAIVATLDAQMAYGRPGPAASDAAIVPAAGVDPARASFPSEHAAVAGAAAAVLTHLFPDAEAGRFDDLAMAAAESRIAAGASFRSDIDVGLALGRDIAALAIARDVAANDVGTWDPTTMPSGPGIWQPTPPAMVETPLLPLGGLRTPWVLESADQFRPAPPPEHGSAVWAAQLSAVETVAATRTFEQERGAVWWGTNSPIVLFDRWAFELINRAGSTLPEAARIMADLHTAIDDSQIAIWDGKYTYWASRPITESPELVTAVPTPPYPAYPAGYPAAMGAGSVMIGSYFPESAVDMEQRAWEASCSRLWAGIHYPIDNDAGLLIGRQVARMVAALDRPDAASV